MTASVAARCQY